MWSNERCAGIDIGKTDVKVCIRTPGPGRRRQRQVRTFTTMTRDLLAMRDWLLAEQVSAVGMEATGAYWKPVYYLLEHDVDCWLLNARHMKAVPGRKTDVKDCEWIAQLVEHGLVRAGFVPPEPIRQLRDLTRYRTEVIRERTREIQRLENAGRSGFGRDAPQTRSVGRSAHRPVRRTSRVPGPGDAGPHRRLHRDGAVAHRADRPAGRYNPFAGNST